MLPLGVFGRHAVHTAQQQRMVRDDQSARPRSIASSTVDNVRSTQSMHLRHRLVRVTADQADGVPRLGQLGRISGFQRGDDVSELVTRPPLQAVRTQGGQQRSTDRSGERHRDPQVVGGQAGERVSPPHSDAALAQRVPQAGAVRHPQQQERRVGRLVHVDTGQLGQLRRSARPGGRRARRPAASALGRRGRRRSTPRTAASTSVPTGHCGRCAASRASSSGAPRAYPARRPASAHVLVRLRSTSRPGDVPAPASDSRSPGTASMNASSTTSVRPGLASARRCRPGAGPTSGWSGCPAPPGRPSSGTRSGRSA